MFKISGQLSIIYGIIPKPEEPFLGEISSLNPLISPNSKAESMKISDRRSALQIHTNKGGVGVTYATAFYAGEIYKKIRFIEACPLHSSSSPSQHFGRMSLSARGAFHVAHPHHFFHITALKESIGNTS